MFLPTALEDLIQAEHGVRSKTINLSIKRNKTGTEKKTFALKAC